MISKYEIGFSKILWRVSARKQNNIKFLLLRIFYFIPQSCKYVIRLCLIFLIFKKLDRVNITSRSILSDFSLYRNNYPGYNN